MLRANLAFRSRWVLVSMIYLTAAVPDSAAQRGADESAPPAVG